MASESLPPPDGAREAAGPSFSLAGHRALVTGGSRGIGQAIALAYAHAGAVVAVAGRSEATLRETVARLGPGRGVPIVMDLQDVDSVREAVDRAEAALGGLTVLVNNAGVNVPQPALTATPEAWDAIFATNVKGLFFCAQAAARGMGARGGGLIVNVGSVLQEVGRAGRVVYAASKGAVGILTKSLALEWAPLNIRVNAVAPAYTLTTAVEQALADPGFREDVLRRTPLGRIARVEDVVGAAVFLASPAAAYMTGQTVFVDGGWLAQ